MGLCEVWEPDFETWLAVYGPFVFVWATETTNVPTENACC